MKTICIVETKTGNTTTFLDFFTENFSEPMDLYINGYDKIQSIKSYDKIIIGTYTWASGKIPKKLKEFIIKHHTFLKGKDIFVFGSGNSVYPKFCGAVDGLEIICRKSLCKSFTSFKFEQRFHKLELTPEELIKLKDSINNFKKM